MVQPCQRQRNLPHSCAGSFFVFLSFSYLQSSEHPLIMSSGEHEEKIHEESKGKITQRNKFGCRSEPLKKIIPEISTGYYPGYVLKFEVVKKAPTNSLQPAFFVTDLNEDEQ